MQDKVDLRSLEFDQLEAFVTKRLGQPKFRAKQMFSWLYRGVSSFSQMTDLSKALQSELTESAVLTQLTIERKLVSKLDRTTKYVFRLEDENFIEAVVMFYQYGTSICVSTQVGCRMGCTFCASAIGGLVRSLKPSEIVGQILAAQQDLGIRISHVVLMGMGEPLDNFDHVVTFLNIVNDKRGLGISLRHISLSTCGLVDKMQQLQQLSLPITLCISLHAPNDDMRRKIMPVARKYDMDALLSACRDYAKATGRRITFEYTLIDGINDQQSHARELAGKLRGMLCHVNLIPVNPVEETGYRRADRKNVERFRMVLEKAGVETTIRRELGADINAACGQLRKAAQKPVEDQD